MSKTVIVTGGCGYIGSHVARAFKYADVNNRVYIIDRVKRDHTLKGMDGWFIDDFASDESLATITNLKPDVIVHCAGTSLVGPSMTEPAEYYNNNIGKTLRLLDIVRDLPTVPVIMFSSSASVYGEPDSWPITEQNDIQPISPYGATKAMTERILSDYHNAYGMSSICFRYFNAAGAMPIEFDLGQESGATHIIARVLEASLAKRAFTINGGDFDTPDGTCIRDYVHVWDIARAHVLASEQLFDESDKSGAYVLNLGTGQGVSNKQIVDYVHGTYGLSFVNYGSARPGDPAELVADATQARNLLAWVPKYSEIQTIIDSAYKWYSSAIRQ
jgi:UDP-glucose 4-epimerase